MELILYVLGILWVILGALAILYTQQFRAKSDMLLKQVDPRYFAVLSLLAGILLLAASPSSRHAWFVRLLGLMAMAKSGLLFINPAGLYEKMVSWLVDRMSDQAYRFWGIVMLIIGTAIVSWVK
jgi:hypothetical protein